MWINSTYEPGTQLLSTSRAEREGTSGVDRAVTYDYDESGNVDSVTDASRQGTDRQCFRYDYLQRLTEAWTPAGDCAAAPDATALGGPAPYWQSYTYTTGGNGDTDTGHDITGKAAGDVTRTYRYDENGKGQPNTLTSVSSAGAVTGKDAYLRARRRHRVPHAERGGQADVRLGLRGQLSSVTEGSATTQYLYDADGKRLISRGPGGVSTLYLGATEITWTKATGKTTARRYYDLGGANAVRQDDGKLSFVVADPTAPARSPSTPRRRPWCNGAPCPSARRAAPCRRPGTKGFVGGTQDPTGLTHLGAREYDPRTGRFLSADAVIDPTDPQQLNGYAYGHNNPLRRSDPTGDYDPDMMAWCQYNPGRCQGGRIIPSKPSKPKKNPNPGMDRKRAHMPDVNNERLKGIIKELYIRPQVADKHVKGDGKTATVLIEEMNEGNGFGGDGTKWHIEKTVDKLGGLREIRKSVGVQGITSDDLVTQLLRLLPEVNPYFEKAARRHDLSASQVTHWEQVNTHPGTLLSEVLAHPLFQPLMESPEIDAQGEDFLERCFEFIEALEEDPTGRLVDTAYVTFVESFLESREVLDRAFRFAWPRTRAEILSMLRAWNVPVDPAWEDGSGEGGEQG
ncbi:RHS repeat-associated core domain-containing protein [Streptomyces sp. NPDC021608]|uniref:RHS repeat-associated core domain-containing protein n=1 Tax=Streptomyces sp. NPDC021608 TaxID=3154903 RepID=UPI0034061F41